MKNLFLKFVLVTYSFPVWASPERSLVCRDVEFGAGHFKLIINSLGGFFAPRELKPVVKAEFWVKGDKYDGILEQASFMPDWGANSGLYRSTPSLLDYSLCDWKKCPARKVKLMVYTKDQLKGEGNIKFLLQTAKNEQIRFERQLHCEIR